jgi:hypothetical protein
VSAGGPTRALVLETENLVALGALDEAVTASMELLLAELARGELPLADLEEVVLTHEGLEPRALARLTRAAGRPVRFVEVPRGCGYYEAKNRGFDATSADVVAFGDADCWPDAGWLAALFALFAGGSEVRVVAGRTSYARGALGDALTAIDFRPIASPLRAGCVRHFLANNVAFRRDVFAARRYASRPDLHRGACGVLALRLHEEAIAIHLAADAHTTHRTPDGPRELFARRLHRGSDMATLAPEVARAHLPARFRWVGRMRRAAPMAMLGGRLVLALPVLARPRRGAVARAAIAVGITAIDALGAVRAGAAKR